MGRMEDIDARLKSRMDAMNNRLADRMAALDARRGGGERTGVEFPAGSVEAWLQPGFDDIKTLFDYIRQSHVVTDNPKYRAALDKVNLVYLTDSENPKSNSVNASANDRKITLCAGFVRQARIAGSALAATNGIEIFGCLRKVVDDNSDWADSITIDEAKELFTAVGLRYDAIIADESVRQESVDRSSAAILACLAHEAGHIALAHVNANVDYYEVNLEVARNQERQADSFMSSVIATVPFGGHMFEAELYNDYLNAVAERSAAKRSGRKVSDRGSTHPLSIERYNNLLKDHPGLAEKYGFVPLSLA